MRVYYHTIDPGVSIGSLIWLDDRRQTPYSVDGISRDEWHIRLVRPGDDAPWGVATEVPNDQPYIEAIRSGPASVTTSLSAEDERIVSLFSSRVEGFVRSIQERFDQEYYSREMTFDEALQRIRGAESVEELTRLSHATGRIIGRVSNETRRNEMLSHTISAIFDAGRRAMAQQRDPSWEQLFSEAREHEINGTLGQAIEDQDTVDQRLRTQMLQNTMHRQSDSVVGTAVTETDADGLAVVQLNQSVTDQAIDSLNELLDRVREIQESRPGLVEMINSQPQQGSSLGSSLTGMDSWNSSTFAPQELATPVVSDTETYPVTGWVGGTARRVWPASVGIPERPGFNMTDQQREILRELVNQTFNGMGDTQAEPRNVETESQKIRRIREEIGERPLEQHCTLQANPIEDGQYLTMDREAKWYYRSHVIEGRLYLNDSTVAVRNDGFYLSYGPIRRRSAPEASTTRILEI